MNKSRSVTYMLIVPAGLCCAFFASCFVLGCSALVPLALRFDRDVSSNSELVGGYQLLAVYELQRDVFLFKKEAPAKRRMLVPPKPLDADPGFGLGEWSAPESLEAYQSNKSEWKEILAVIERGTQIRCTAIHEYGAPGWGSSIYIHGELLSGPYKGATVDMTELSHVTQSERRDPQPIKPDPRLLVVETGALTP